MVTLIGVSLFLSLLALAAWTDVRTRRIPNVLTLVILGGALLLRATQGTDFLVAGLLGAGLAFALVLPLFAVNGLGGGDAKLLIAAGAFLGPLGFLQALLFTALAGAALSLVAVARGGLLVPALFDTAELMKYWLSLGWRGERRSLATPGVTSVPYGVAIALGCTAALFLGGGL